MRPILLDTNGYSAYKKGKTEIVEVIQQSEFIGISPIVVGELMVGFDNGSRPDRNREELQEFLESPRIIIYSINLDTAQFFSQILCALKKKGKPIPTNDIWIAAQALEHGSVVCTYDKHFSFIDGLISGCNTRSLFI